MTSKKKKQIKKEFYLLDISIKNIHLHTQKPYYKILIEKTGFLSEELNGELIFLTWETCMALNLLRTKLTASILELNTLKKKFRTY